MGTDPTRVEYATACRAWRHTMRQANRLRPRLGSFQRAVLDAVLQLTAGYSRLTDIATVRMVAMYAYGLDGDHEVTGNYRDDTNTALNVLAERGLFTLVRSGKGPAARITITLESPPPAGGNHDDESPPPADGITPPGRCESPPPEEAHREVSEQATEQRETWLSAEEEENAIVHELARISKVKLETAAKAFDEYRPTLDGIRAVAETQDWTRIVYKLAEAAAGPSKPRGNDDGTKTCRRCGQGRFLPSSGWVTPCECR